MLLLFLLVILNVQSNDFFVVVELFPFFNVLSIFCVSTIDSSFLFFSFGSNLDFEEFLLDFALDLLISGKTLLFDNERNLLRPIFNGNKKEILFQRCRQSSFTLHVTRPTKSNNSTEIFFSPLLFAIALQTFLLHIIFWIFIPRLFSFLCYFCFNFLNIEKSS